MLGRTPNPTGTAERARPAATVLTRHRTAAPEKPRPRLNNRARPAETPGAW